MSEHLKLLFYEKDFKRLKRGGGYYSPRTDRDVFANSQILKLGEIKDNFKKDREKIQYYYNPNLIFKVKLRQKVDEETFIKFMNSRNIKVISASPTGVGYWILLAEDVELDEILNNLKEYSKEEKYKIFNTIDSFEIIPSEEKIGEYLKEKPFRTDEIAYLDIEIWRMEQTKLENFLEGFSKLISDKGCIVTDKLITENLCLLRIKLNKSVYQEVIGLREVSRIDRPSKPYIEYGMLTVPLEKFSISGSPNINATAIAVIDSGIISSHPLLENAVGDEFFAPLESNKRGRIDNVIDDVGHGTKVASIALYGDIKKCIEEKVFNPEVWILSAKIMFKDDSSEFNNPQPVYDEDELLEHQFERTINYFLNNYPNCKVINISFGNNLYQMYENKKQFPLATLIDELAYKFGIIFIISTGNLNWKERDFPEKYPTYLIEEKENVKIIDPSSSAYSLTVGSICQEYGPSTLNQSEMKFSPAKTNYPSPFTRVGPGYKGMIKPELVEEGGNIIISPNDPLKNPDISGNLIVFNSNWIKDGKLFTVDCGTSFSTPKVSNQVARLINNYPDYSSNLIKALLIASAEIPEDRPGKLNEITYNDSNEKLLDLLKVYGYGKPDLNRAISSISNNVLLIEERKIKIDHIHFFYLYLPKEFIDYSGNREISVVLTYNPPIRRNRIDYIGIGMETHLFKNLSIDEVEENYNQILREAIEKESEEIVPEKLKGKEIELKPGVKLRSKSLHQKGIKIYKKAPEIDINKPLVLVVISRGKWLKDEDYLQSYAVLVKVKHQAQIDIYNRIRQQLEIKGRIRIRP